MFCRLQTHRWCFIIFNIMLFHALLFGGDLLEEYFLHSLPVTYTDMKVLKIREKARKLDMDPLKTNMSKSYIISSSEVCSDQEVFLLVIACSSPENRTRRNLIRRTWGNVTGIRGYAVLILFVLGMPASETIQLDISEESQKHGDIIEGNFLDSFKNQTLKIVMSMEWTITFCSTARFVLKTDEEMFVNIPSLAEYLLSLRTHRLEDIYIGRVIHQDVPDRDPQSQSFVSLSQYQDEYYPDYCSGTAFVISQDVARKIYVVAKETPVLVPPDVFVGICAKNAGIIPIQSSRFSGKKYIRYNRCCYKFIFTSSEMKDELFKEWREISDGKDCTLLETYYGLVSCRVLTYFDKFKHFNLETIKKEALHFTN
ncbi:beta-1,3-galactosyltransferase 9 [Macrochelys suwanniensis]